MSEQEPTRRERYRRQTVAEIKAAAMDQLCEGSIDTAVPYRCFPSRDALVAHLVAAHRGWALRHRRRYGMLFAERADDGPGQRPAQTPLDQAMALLVDLLVAIQDTAPSTGSCGNGHTLRCGRSNSDPSGSTSAVAAEGSVPWSVVDDDNRYSRSNQPRPHPRPWEQIVCRGIRDHGRWRKLMRISRLSAQSSSRVGRMVPGSWGWLRSATISASTA
jgi:hypothetical protein